MAQAEMRYLLAVYQLCEDGSEVRSVDVAGFLDISRASVAKQMKLLLQKGLIEKQRYGGIRLSAEGARQASALHLQYTLCREYLTRELGVSAPCAKRDAITCVCEWSQESIERMGGRVLGDTAANE